MTTIFFTEEYQLDAHGLDEEGAPLTNVARCVSCQKELARHVYRREETCGCSMEAFMRLTFSDAEKACNLARQHACRSH